MDAGTAFTIVCGACLIYATVSLVNQRNRHQEAGIALLKAIPDDIRAEVLQQAFGNSSPFYKKKNLKSYGSGAIGIDNLKPKPPPPPPGPPPASTEEEDVRDGVELDIGFSSYERLNRLVERTGYDTAQVFSGSLALLEKVTEASDSGYKVIIVDDNMKLVHQFVNIIKPKASTDG